MSRICGTKAELLKKGITVKYSDSRYIQVAEVGSKDGYVMRRYTVGQDGYANFQFKEKHYKVTDLTTGVEIDIEVEHENKKRKVEIDFTKAQTKTEDGKIRHAKYNQIKACVMADIPVYLVGEAGTGKNFTLQELAEDLKTDFYFTSIDESSKLVFLLY